MWNARPAQTQHEFWQTLLSMAACCNLYECKAFCLWTSLPSIRSGMGAEGAAVREWRRRRWAQCVDEGPQPPADSQPAALSPPDEDQRAAAESRQDDGRCCRQGESKTNSRRTRCVMVNVKGNTTELWGLFRRPECQWERKSDEDPFFMGSNPHKPKRGTKTKLHLNMLEDLNSSPNEMGSPESASPRVDPLLVAVGELWACVGGKKPTFIPHWPHSNFVLWPSERGFYGHTTSCPTGAHLDLIVQDSLIWIISSNLIEEIKEEAPPPPPAEFGLQIKV